MELSSTYSARERAAATRFFRTYLQSSLLLDPGGDKAEKVTLPW